MNNYFNKFKNLFKSNSGLNLDVFFYFYLIMITINSLLAQYLFKYLPSFNKKYKTPIIIFAIMLYALNGYFVYKIIDYGDIIILNIIWHIVYFFALFIIGYLYFNEKITFQKIIGLIFGMLSLIIFMKEGLH